MSGCGLIGNDGGGAQAAAVDTPATNELPIPPLLEPEMIGAVAHYDMSIGEATHDFGNGVQADTLSYSGLSVLGPTLLWNEGDRVEIDLTNNLDVVTTTHWHGADVPADADGGPHSRIEPGETWRAGFPVIQPAATLWYHPHLMGTTAEEVFAGAAGMIIVADDNPATANLPSTYGVDDLPIVLQDREFDAAGQLAFELDDDDNGDLNPDLTVNAAMDVYATVPAGPVRLRLVNGSQARVYNLGVDNGSMVKIASDGGYLEGPVSLDTLVLAPGDRAEIIVDTSDGGAVLTDEAFGRVLELRADESLPVAEHPPAQLAVIDRIDPASVDADRTFALGEVGDGWGINGQQMDMMRIDETIALNDTERWTIVADEGVHAFHVHQTQFQILEINGEAPAPEDRGWEDTVLVADGDQVVVAARFDTYANPDVPYMFHCHILDHEDTGMMGQFQVIEG